MVVFDYRGFGRSLRQPGIRGLFYDTRHLLDWLAARADVDRSTIAYYGISVGSLAALHAARTGNACAALVLENIPSPRDNIHRDRHGTYSPHRARHREPTTGARTAHRTPSSCKCA